MVYIKSFSLGSHKFSPKVDTVIVCILQLGKLYPWETDIVVEGVNPVSQTVKAISENIVSYRQQSQTFRGGKDNNITSCKLSST